MNATHRRQIRLPLRMRLILGFGSILLLIVVFGSVSVLEFIQVQEASRMLQEEAAQHLAISGLSRASSDLLSAVDRAILARDPELFEASASSALTELDAQQKHAKDALQNSAPIESSLNAIVGVVSSMMIRANAGDWEAVERDRFAELGHFSRLGTSVDSLNSALDDLIEVSASRQKQAEVQLTTARQAFFASIAILFVLGTAVGAYFIFTTGNTITRSMKALLDAVNRLTNGEWETGVEIRTGDELGQLGQAFNDMVQQLRGLNADLEQQIVDRTSTVERRTAQLEAASLVAGRSAAIRDVGNLLRTAVGLVSDRFGYYHAGIYLIDENQEHAVLRAASSDGGQQLLAQRHKLQVGQVGIVGNAAASGQARIALDVGEDAVFFNNPFLPETRSELAIPLRVRDQTIGVLDLQSTEAEAFSKDDLAVLQTLADQLAMAIENASLLEEAQGRLQEIGSLLGQHSQEGWQQLTSGRQDWGYTYDGIQIQPKGKASQKKEPQIRLPISSRGQHIGQLSLDMGERPATGDHVRLAEAVAEQLGMALENARLFRESQQRLAELETLQRTSMQLTSLPDLPTALDMITENTLALLRASHSRLYRYDERLGRFGYGTAIWSDGRRERDLAPPATESLAAMVVQGSQPIMIDDVTEHPAITTEAGAWQARAVAGLPIRRGGWTLGVLIIGLSAARPFVANEQRLLDLIIDQAAVALDNARLFEQAQRGAERERLLTQMSASIQQEALDLDMVLQTAVREIGETLDLAWTEIQMGSGPAADVA